MYHQELPQQAHHRLAQFLSGGSVHHGVSPIHRGMTGACHFLLRCFVLASPLRHPFAAGSDDAADGGGPAAVEHPHCRLFLAESTIPNAGLGIFTGVDLRPGDHVAEPDLVVPLQDYDWHADADANDFHFLWYDYSWNGMEVGMETDMESASALVLGTGCMPNCNFALINAKEGKPEYDHAGLHRSRDPGIGGFTGFHDQRMSALRDVPAGGELFVSYGEPWFDERVREVGVVPYERSFKRVDKFLKKFKKLSLKYQTGDNDFTRDLWDVVAARANYETKNVKALPLSFEDMQRAQTIGSAETRLPYSVRTLEWLREHGRCMDNIRPGRSTIEQAGRGAFATRPIPKGGLVAPGPVLHVPNRTVLNLYGVGDDGLRDTSEVVGTQMILNYCFGHKKSTVILCPYTSPSAYINHSSKSPNAEVVWASESTPNHNRHWLDEDVHFLKRMGRIGLSLNFVATRDIRPGEEVFIDYGPEWEEAWEKHVNEWSAPPGSEHYQSASVLQKDLTTPLRTETEQRSEPYPDNVLFYCHYQYETGQSEGPWTWTDQWADLPLTPCKIISRDSIDVGDAQTHYYYTTVMLDEDEMRELEGAVVTKMDYLIPSGEEHVLAAVPRWAIQARDELYSKDEFMQNAFRHEMMMPDEMFPETWKNVVR